MDDLEDIAACFLETELVQLDGDETQIQKNLKRTSEISQDKCFHDYRSETEMMRYLHRLASKDLGRIRR